MALALLMLLPKFAVVQVAVTGQGTTSDAGEWGAVLTDGHHTNLRLLTHSTFQTGPFPHPTSDSQVFTWRVSNFYRTSQIQNQAVHLLPLPSMHNRRPFEQASMYRRHLKGLCHTHALYPHPCITIQKMDG